MYVYLPTLMAKPIVIQDFHMEVKRESISFGIDRQRKRSSSRGHEMFPVTISLESDACGDTVYSKCMHLHLSLFVDIHNLYCGHFRVEKLHQTQRRK